MFIVEDYGFRLLSPFSGLATSKLKTLSTNLKGSICGYIVFALILWVNKKKSKYGVWK